MKEIPTQVFSCEHFWEHLFWRTSANCYFCRCPAANLQRHILQFPISIFHLQFCNDTILTLEIQVLYWVFICKHLKILLSRFNCEVKFLSTSSHQTNLQNFSYLVTSFFTPLPVSLLLYIQPLNGIIGVMSKNSKAMLSINIVEVIDREYQRIQGGIELIPIQNGYWNS